MRPEEKAKIGTDLQKAIDEVSAKYVGQTVNQHTLKSLGAELSHTLRVGARVRE